MKQCPKCSGSICRMGHIEKPFYCPECKEWFSNEEVTPKLTNADRIRAMSDEELANWYFSEFFPNAPYCNKLECYPDDPCEQCLLDWLKETAKIEDEEDK